MAEFTHHDIREGSLVKAPGRDKVVHYTVYKVGTSHGENTFLGKDLNEGVIQIVSCSSIREIVRY